MVAMNIPSITVTQVAKKVGRSTGRIRQICLEHDIGVLIGGRVRVFTPKEAKEIEKIISNDRRKNSDNSVDE
jgi:hypothetical protein